MRNANFRKWTSTVLVLSLLLSLLPAMSAVAATARITITNLYISDTQPQISNNSVRRFTSNPVQITATIENVTDSQISELYYEITNVTTSNTPVVEKTNKAQKTGQYDIVFNNVMLTEGLNKIVIKLGETSVVSSASGWAYFTPTTTLSTLLINNSPFEDTKMYPENPAQSSIVNITGTAPNASEVRAYVEGDPAPKNAYLNNSQFYFVGDDINKLGSTANLKLRPGDNPLTIMAVNNSKTFQVKKNLIYDSGKPFAFNAKITELKPDGSPNSTPMDLISSPTVTTSKVRVSAYLKDDLTTLGDLQYKFFEVTVGGQKFGPYNLSGANAAPKALNLSPSVMYTGHSETDLFVTGEAIPDTSTVRITDKSGAVVDVNPGASQEADDIVINPSRTVGVYRIPAGSLSKSGSPYLVNVMVDGRPIHDEPFTITVNDPAFALPDVTSDVPNPPAKVAKAGDPAVPRTLTFAPDVNNPTNVNVSITNLAGQTVGTVIGSGTLTNVTFDIPSITTEGLYKYKVTYRGYPIAEKVFEIDRKDPPNPVITIPSIINVTNFTSVAGAGNGNETPTTLYFAGANLGTSASDIVSLNLKDQVTGALTALNVVEVRDNGIVAVIPDQGALPDGAKYNLELTKIKRYPDGSNAGTVTLPFGSPSAHIAVQNTAGSAAVTSAVVPQMLPTEVGSGSITINGIGLANQNQLSVIIMNEDGTGQRNANVLSANGTTAVADFSTVAGLTAGTYLMKISYAGEVMGQYPLVIADPLPGSFTDNGATVTITGSNLGRNPALLKLRFSPVSNPSQFVDVLANSIDANQRAVFTEPIGLSQGSYTVSLLYNDNQVGNPFNFNVSATDMKLDEVASWSKSNRYKVFAFSADLDIPADKYQAVNFKFYNLPTDSLPETRFTFSYVNPTLPYIDSVKIGEYSLSEGMTNLINELPLQLRVVADTNTNKVNMYFGNYTSSSQIEAYARNPVAETINGVTKNVFTFTLPGTMANGLNKLTFVPTTDATDGSSKNGENVSGRRQYDILVSNAPYVIVNNIYNGLVVKNPNLEITCVKPGDTIQTGSCLTGRFVNIPSNPFTAANTAEVIVNGNSANSIVLGLDNTFYVQVANFIEGKNTITFNIKVNGVIVTSSQYEVFVFSTNAPEFMSIKPVETTDVKKYIAGSRPDTYSTNETGVSFAGQFANATEIKLTVRMKDENGVPIAKYDRRFNNFGSIDPVSANPNYFSSVNSPAGQFSTNRITLAPRGETIFEFAITNASGITVTKAITVVREPLPYIIKYPVLVKNEKNEDQANINSNYIEIQMKAEGATSVLFGKDEAIEREVIENGVREKHFFYEVTGLKPGKNTVKFTVVRGEEKMNGSFVLYNVNTPVEGAQYKTPMSSTMTAFNGQVTLKFPRGTNFVRNEPGAVNQFLTADRKILFGIASNIDGRVDKYKHPSPTDGQIGNPNFPIDGVGKLMLTTPPRYRAASNLFWIDAGTIKKNETDLVSALSGSGRLPYDRDEFYLRMREDLVVPTQRGTLTLKYDPVIRDDAWKYVTVYHFDIYEDYTGIVQGRWRNMGGVVDTKNNTITVPLETFGYYQVMYMDQSFDDVTGHPWARNELDTLYAKGIMLNKESSNFVPNDPITRGEFTTMLVKIFDLPLQYSEVPTFRDVQRVNLLTNLYDYKYIETAARAGIVRGSTGGRFLPDNAITRQDAAIMIARAADLKLSSDSDLNKVLASLRKTFTDADSIDLYARTAVEAVAKAGLIEGKDNVLLQGQKNATVRFDPLETFTRAEAAIVAMRVLKDQKKVPK